jgi:SAM-dependent methyltransferase
MIEKATALGQGRPGLSFVVNQRPDLSFVESASIDLVYSNIVLQHMEPEVARVYIREFYRIVTHGGFVVFQIPSHLTQEWLPDARNGTVLADELRDAAITVVDAPVQLAVGERADVVVRVRNVSGGVWYQDLTNQINVANHWLGVDGEVVVHDDGRARLPGRMQAGERADVVLRVRAPSIAGTYLLELDVVQEGTAWFAQHGSTTARWPVRVVDAAAPANGTGADAAGDTSGGADSAATASAGHVAAADPAPEYPTFMMRGIPRDDVEQLVRDLGGEILDAREHVTEWVSYRYVTRRTG